MYLKHQDLVIEGQNILSLSTILIKKKDFKLSHLFKSKIFSEDIRPLYIKENPEKEYLKSLFIPKHLKIDNFKYFNHKEKLLNFLKNEPIANEWIEDEEGFLRLIEKFKALTINNLNDCYLINKNWFSMDNWIVRDREYMLYEYYILLIWLNKEQNMVYVCEWFCD